MPNSNIPNEAPEHLPPVEDLSEGAPQPESDEEAAEGVKKEQGVAERDSEKQQKKINETQKKAEVVEAQVTAEDPEFQEALSKADVPKENIQDIIGAAKSLSPERQRELLVGSTKLVKAIGIDGVKKVVAYYKAGTPEEKQKVFNSFSEAQLDAFEDYASLPAVKEFMAEVESERKKLGGSDLGKIGDVIEKIYEQLAPLLEALSQLISRVMQAWNKVQNKIDKAMKGEYDPNALPTNDHEIDQQIAGGQRLPEHHQATTNELASVDKQLGGFDGKTPEEKKKSAKKKTEELEGKLNTVDTALLDTDLTKEEREANDAAKPTFEKALKQSKENQEKLDALLARKEKLEARKQKIEEKDPSLKEGAAAEPLFDTSTPKEGSAKKTKESSLKETEELLPPLEVPDEEGGAEPQPPVEGAPTEDETGKTKVQNLLKKQGKFYPLLEQQGKWVQVSGREYVVVEGDVFTLGENGSDILQYSDSTGVLFESADIDHISDQALRVLVPKMVEKAQQEHKDNPSTETAARLIDVLALQAKIFSINDDQEGFERVQKAGQTAVKNFLRQRLRTLGDRISSILNREEGYMKHAEKAKEESGWFGWMHRGITQSDPYAVEINTAKRKASVARLRKKMQQESIGSLRYAQSPEDFATIAENIAILERSIKTLNRVDTDKSHFDLEESSLDVSRDVAVSLATLPAAFTGGSAAAGISGAARFGAVQGAKMAALNSGASNIEEVASGDKTVAEGVTSTVTDTAMGAATGALFGAGFYKGGEVMRKVSRRIGRMRRAASKKTGPTVKPPRPKHPKEHPIPKQNPKQKSSRGASKEGPKKEAPKTQRESAQTTSKSVDKDLLRRQIQRKETWVKQTQDAIKELDDDIASAAKFNPDPKSPVGKEVARKIQERQAKEVYLRSLKDELRADRAAFNSGPQAGPKPGASRSGAEKTNPRSGEGAKRGPKKETPDAKGKQAEKPKASTNPDKPDLKSVETPKDYIARMDKELRKIEEKQSNIRSQKGRGVHPEIQELEKQASRIRGLKKQAHALENPPLDPKASPHDILGVSKNPTKRQVEIAYRKMANRYNADMAPDGMATRFAEDAKILRSAYEQVLRLAS